MHLAQPLSRPTACQLQKAWGSEVAACPALPIPTFLGAERGREPTLRGSTLGYSSPHRQALDLTVQVSQPSGQLPGPGSEQHIPTPRQDRPGQPESERPAAASWQMKLATSLLSLA